MIKVAAELNCPRHPRYKARRRPTSECQHCRIIYGVVKMIRAYSKKYVLSWGTVWATPDGEPHV